MKLFTAIFTGLILLGLIGCSETANVPSVDSETAQRTGPDRPDWCMNELEMEGDTMYFSGLSNIYATEKGARSDARRDSINSVVQYLGTLAKTKYEEASISYGLSSQTMDPTTSGRRFEKQVAANVARGLRVTKWHTERETDSIGKWGYKVCALGTIPKSSINNSFRKTAKQNMLDAQREAERAATEQAKAQAERAKDFWKDMQEQGLLD